MDGIALALSCACDYPKLPIVLMTGHADRRERASGLEALVQNVIAKPFTLAEIKFAVAAALPLVSALSTTPLLGARATVQSARAAWHRFMLLNVPMGAVASALLIASWQ